MRIRLKNVKTSEIGGILLDMNGDKASNLFELADMLERDPFNIRRAEDRDEISAYLKTTINQMGDSTMNTAYDVLYHALTTVNFPSDTDLENQFKDIKRVSLLLVTNRNSRRIIWKR